MYKVKSRYNTYYQGDDPEEAYQIFQELKRGGKVVTMTPDLHSKGLSMEFSQSGNDLIFENDFIARLVATNLENAGMPIKRDGKKIEILNKKFASKVVYLTEKLLQKSNALSDISDNKLGITNDIKKWRVNLENGKSMTIFALSEQNALNEVREKTDDKIKNIKQVSNG